MSRRGLFCKCLYELENNLPRTKRCRRPCAAQDLILEEREAMEKEVQITPTINSEDLKTSKEWYELIPVEHGLFIMDPDGWDRSNYDYSFEEEKITKAEFVRRLSYSTIMSKITLHEFLSNW